MKRSLKPTLKNIISQVLMYQPTNLIILGLNVPKITKLQKKYNKKPKLGYSDLHLNKNIMSL